MLHRDATKYQHHCDIAKAHGTRAFGSSLMTNYFHYMLDGHMYDTFEKFGYPTFVAGDGLEAMMGENLEGRIKPSSPATTTTAPTAEAHAPPPSAQLPVTPAAALCISRGGARPLRTRKPTSSPHRRGPNAPTLSRATAAAAF